jgi:crossover junction endodeoxyribonuclease RusA
MINVRLPWPPQVNNYYTVIRGRKALSAKGAAYKKQAGLELMVQRAKKGLTCRLEVNIDAYPPDARVRDLDNICKPLLDSLQDYGMFNDGQIDILRIRRMEKGGYVRVHIVERE